MSERFVVVGLARVRAPWFAEVGRWADSSLLPLEFLKCVSATEVRARLATGRTISALLVDAGAAGVDRDLLDEARRRGVGVVVVADGLGDRDWIALGASAVLPDEFTADILGATLAAHAWPVRDSDAPSGADDSEAQVPSAWRGTMIAVTGGRGSGASTLAMALAQGMAQQPGNADAVALADLAGCGDQAMYHDVRDVVPGLQELVEVHRTAAPGRSVVRRHLYDIDERGYSVLLGLRRRRDWTALRPRSLAAAIDSLRATFRVVVADVDPETDGEAETGSVDMEECNGPARAALAGADAVVVCGDASLKGVHSLARVERDVIAFGVDPRRIVRVVNRAPRSPRVRADLTRTVDALGGDRRGEGGLGVVFLPERRQLDVVHGVVAPLPQQLTTPLTRAVTAVLDGRTDRQPNQRTRSPEPDALPA